MNGCPLYLGARSYLGRHPGPISTRPFPPLEPPKKTAGQSSHLQSRRPLAAPSPVVSLASRHPSRGAATTLPPRPLGDPPRARWRPRPPPAPWPLAPHPVAAPPPSP